MARIFLTHTPTMLTNYYGERALAELRTLGEVKLNTSDKVLDAGALAREARGCEIVITDRQTAGPAGVFPQLPDCVAFLRVAIDIRNIDVAAASREGILITHASAGFIASVAEMAIGYMVDLGRSITQSTAEYRSGQDAEPRMGKQLQGATLGILGYGAIGQYLARLGVALGMTVLVSDPFKTIAEPGVTQASFADVLSRSDFVVCLVVATDETENLMNTAAFARMRRDAFFLNLSRGNLVDEAALAAALDNGQIAGAAMDVGRAPDQKPSLFLARRPDVIATPHTAGLTPQAAEHQAFDTVRQTRDILAGRIPPGAVNPEAATRMTRLKR
ncbi:MAG: D-3-phosphoglycerate dehydrogenase [Pseudolabrys sp.]|jgi:D-3-phosphoglycerate dehydrogenase|nr:D-3-phosphoglycerate dehydrogenase [Pseudolabrys sp.]